MLFTWSYKLPPYLATSIPWHQLVLRSEGPCNRPHRVPARGYKMVTRWFIWYHAYRISIAWISTIYHYRILILYINTVNQTGSCKMTQIFKLELETVQHTTDKLSGLWKRPQTAKLNHTTWLPDWGPARGCDDQSWATQQTKTNPHARGCDSQSWATQQTNKNKTHARGCNDLAELRNKQTKTNFMQEGAMAKAEPRNKQKQTHAKGCDDQSEPRNKQKQTPYKRVRWSSWATQQTKTNPYKRVRWSSWITQQIKTNPMQEGAMIKLDHATNKNKPHARGYDCQSWAMAWAKPNQTPCKRVWTSALD